jgi:zinc D-Ala-D-Ala carboxypeptidase
MNLSPHFTLDELTHSQTAERDNLDNTPGPDALAALRRTAMGLEAVRIRLGGAPILISSGYRGPAVNAAVKGSKTSQHMKGEAADFTAPRFGTPRQIVDALAESDVPYDQLILEFAHRGRGWVHISFAAAPRRMALIVDPAGTRPLLA